MVASAAAAPSAAAYARGQTQVGAARCQTGAAEAAAAAMAGAPPLQRWTWLVIVSSLMHLLRQSLPPGQGRRPQEVSTGFRCASLSMYLVRWSLNVQHCLHSDSDAGRG